MYYQSQIIEEALPTLKKKNTFLIVNSVQPQFDGIRSVQGLYLPVASQWTAMRTQVSFGNQSYHSDLRPKILNS